MTIIPLAGIFLAITFQASTVLVPGGTVSFYVHDDDLNISHKGVDEVSVSGLLDFKIAGTSITGPEKIVETGIDSGVFVGKVSIPTTINGRDIKDGDVLTITYNDESDASGNSNTVSKSIKVKKLLASIETSQNRIRIGQTFQIRIIDPDYNLDSRESDNISLSLIEFRSSNGIRTTLANPVFDAKTPSLRETGDNTGKFAVTLKMPKEIDGKRVKIGSTAELRYTDTSSPSGTTEKLKLIIRIGSR